MDLELKGKSVLITGASKGSVKPAQLRLQKKKLRPSTL